MDAPHYGCPQCGSPHFTASQDVTEYCTETAYCTFTSQEPVVVPEFDVEETDNRDCHDSDIGDLDDLKRCLECSHEYTAPVFYCEPNTLERIAERSDIAPRDLAFLVFAFATLPHASTITVRQEAHATLVDAAPRTIARNSWTVSACSRCNAEMDEPRYCTRQVYRPRPGGLIDREIVFDRRLLPVLLHASLCSACR